MQMKNMGKLEASSGSPSRGVGSALPMTRFLDQATQPSRFTNDRSCCRSDPTLALSRPSDEMDVSMADHGRVPPTLDTLPSELRKLIVSFLAPAYLYPGSKQALKNANLAQRCLREWVPEYLFRDMALLHVMTGITSHLEYFTTHPDTADYTRYVKRVVIKVCSHSRPGDALTDVHRCLQACAGRSAPKVQEEAGWRTPCSAFVPNSMSSQSMK